MLEFIQKTNHKGDIQMLKTIKGKVIAGTVTMALVAGAGSAFANLDAGDKLQAWYNGQFGTSSQEVTNQVQSHVTGKISGLNAEYNGLRSAATTSINSTRDSSTTRATNVINSKNQEYITDVQNQEAAIQAYMDDQFDAITATFDGLIDQADAFAINYANQNLGALTNEVGGQAVDKVEEDLNATRVAAKTALENAITNAKNALDAQLASEKASTVEEINGKIDTRINELRVEITQIKDDLVAAQQKLINDEAKRQLEAAKTELESVVNGI